MRQKNCTELKNPTFQPVYNYCKFYEPTWNKDEKTCKFNKDIVVNCAADAEYTFLPFAMESSVATENNLVRCSKNSRPPPDVPQYCSQYIWTPTIDSFFMIGLLAGSFIFGVLSDKIGRRHTLLLATLTCALGNLAGAFVSNKWGYAILRFPLFLLAHLFAESLVEPEVRGLSCSPSP